MTDHKANPIALGKRIKEYRTSRDYTQEQLSILVDSAPEYISQLERGASIPSLSMIILICEVLEIDPTCLLQDMLPRSVSSDKRIAFRLFADWLSDEQLSLLINLLDINP